MIGLIAYAAAAAMYSALATILLVGYRGGFRAGWVAAAIAATALWAAAVAFQLLPNGGLPLPRAVGLDALHLVVWTGCVLSLAREADTHRMPRLNRYLMGLSAVGGVSAFLAAWSFEHGSAASHALHLMAAALSVIGFVSVAVVWKPTEAEQLGRLRVFLWATACIFGAHLLVYAQALLVGEPHASLWNGRGAAVALVGPLIVLALRNGSLWDRQLDVSRQAAVYTAAIVAIGAYLLMVVVGGRFLHDLGGTWGYGLQVAFSLVAIAGLAIVLLSSSVQARLRVFVTKHFYKNKYDYREEWLTLTERLAETGDPLALASRALAAMADIIHSTDGELWLRRGHRRYECIASLQGSVHRPHYDADHPLPVFLATRRWVIDSEEYEARPSLYGSAFGPPSDGLLPPNSIVVPLELLGSLEGFVVLRKPAGAAALNFEDHDILKTAGRQIAVFLAQAIAQQQLTETRQFEAVNKLSIFLMHDLKNLIAQQELVVANAQRFRHRPDFVDDSIMTIKAGVERMKKIMEQLRGAAVRHRTNSRADASKVVAEVESRCSDRLPAPRAQIGAAPCWVGMDREDLVSCLTHLVRNAQDATPPDGEIVIRLEKQGNLACITVSDTGHGMDPSFVETRLFKPFDSTKGAKGMGIGAYQVKEAVEAVGGEVIVRSQVGFGTDFEMRLPCVLQPSQAVLSETAA